MASTVRTQDDLLAIARKLRATPASRPHHATNRYREPLAVPEGGEHRYERKYRVDNQPLAMVEAWLRQHPALFSPIYQPRWINNVYLDTPDFRSVWENLNGCGRRVKTRVRWYGSMLGSVNAPVVERKIRNGIVGTKQIYVLPPFEMDATPDLPAVHAAVAEADLPPVIRLDVALMKPVILNRYQRRYYQSGDGRFRATVDTELAFHPLLGPASGMLKPHPLRNAIVLEVKYAPQDDRDAAWIADNLPARATRNSKYITGMQMCYPIPDMRD